MSDFSKITPIQFGTFTSEKPASVTGNQGIESFKNIFESAISDVKKTELELANQQYLLTTGQTDDPSAVTVAAAEAQLSVDMLVSLRTKTLEAYNSLINMQL